MDGHDDEKMTIILKIYSRVRGFNVWGSRTNVPKKWLLTTYYESYFLTLVSSSLDFYLSFFVATLLDTSQVRCSKQ